MATIAPACQFAWGGSSNIIEICTAQGIEKITVAGEQKGSNDLPDAHGICDFCFQQNHLSFATTDEFVFLARFVKPENLLPSYQAGFYKRKFTPYLSRDPPVET